MYLRIVAAVIVIAAQLASAGTVEQRSPFVQGNWWNPERSGSGIEIFNSGDQTMAIWYTYDAAGKPVWYTAQGATSTLGTAQWPLLQHRWANGRKADPAQVGTLKITFRNVQSAELDFTVNGASGKWAIQPFVATAMIGDTDHSGSWYDPANSGWGLTVIQQAEVLGGALFTYDAAGDATWVSGFDRGTNTIEYYQYSGTCPSCAYKPFTTKSVGRLTFDFADEYHATVRNGLALAMAPGVRIDGASVVQFSRPMSFRAIDRELASFSDDFALKDYLQAGVLNSQPPAAPGGFSAGSPSSSGTTYSTTNLQESGVDEADLMKNTAAAVYAFAYDQYGVRQPALRIAPITGSSMGAVVTVPLTVGAATSSYSSPYSYAGLFADDNVLVAITGSQPLIYTTMSPWALPGVWAGSRTMVEIFDATNAAAPQSKWHAQLDGAVVATRRIGKRLYLVTRSSPTPGQGFTYYASAGSSSEARNREIVAQMSLADLIPAIRINGGSPQRAVQASNMFAPPQGMRQRSADTLLITAIDLEKRQIAQTLGIAGAAEAIYVSPGNMYLVSSRYELRTPAGAMTLLDPYGAASDIHQIALGETGMSVVASGSVDGVVGIDQERAPFQLSEYQGRLRVVSQSNSIWGANKNRVTILQPAVTTAGTVLKSVSYIPSIWRPEPLGKPGELLYSTRFLGDRLYAVTFKKVDPLYVVDLSDATSPRIAGALQMPGFATYLHPLENGLVLGFGKEAVPATVTGDGDFAWYQGLMLALYDVTDPANPREIQRATWGKRGSDSAALRDHHAFTTLRVGNSTMVTFPGRIHDGSAVADPTFFYPWSYSGAIRYEIRGTTPQTAQIIGLPDLVTSAPPSPSPSPDAAVSNARTVTYPGFMIYVANGQFWRMDGVGKSGPY